MKDVTGGMYFGNVTHIYLNEYLSDNDLRKQDGKSLISVQNECNY